MRRNTLPNNLYIVYALYEDGTRGVLSYDTDRQTAVDYCRHMQERMACNIYVQEYEQTTPIIVL